MRFKDFPSPLTYETYGLVRSEVASALFEMRGVESVFCCGSTSAPGISDLDFFITVDPSVFDKQKLVEFYSGLSGPTLYTAGHHYPFLAPSGWEHKFHSILPLSNSKLFDGRHFSSYDVALTDKEIFPILCDLILCFYPRIFFIPIMRKEIEVRQSLMALRAFRFVLKYTQKIDENKQLGASFVASVEHLTENYFKLNDEHRLAELLRLMHEGYQLSHIVISKVASYLRSSSDFEVYNTVPHDIYLRGLSNIIFSRKSQRSCRMMTENIYRVTGRFITFMPFEFSNLCYSLFREADGVDMAKESFRTREATERFLTITAYEQFVVKYLGADLLVWPPYFNPRAPQATPLSHKLCSLIFR